MKAESLVIKEGSHWRGEVTGIDDNGDISTNFLVQDIKPFIVASTLWIEFENAPFSVRGLAVSRQTAEPGQLIAVSGIDGHIQIVINQGNAAQKTKLKVGDPIDLFFRT